MNRTHHAVQMALLTGLLSGLMTSAALGVDALGRPASPGSRTAPPIRVLTLDESRTAECDSIDYNVFSGSFYEDLREVLAEQSLFGDGGVVPRSVHFITSVSRITGSALEGVDMVLLSTNAVPLDDCERQFLRSFVEQGGGVMAFFNDAAFEVGPVFDASGRQGIEGGVCVAKVRSSALVDGPFGKVPLSMPLMWHRLFGSIGPYGTEVFGAPRGLPFLASFAMGQGRGMIACDEEWIGSQIDEGCAVANLDDPKMTLFLNAFAYCMPSEGFSFVPSGGLLGDINEDCRVDGIDLGLLRGYWGTSDPKADLNGDGVVDGADLGILLANWTG